MAKYQVKVSFERLIAVEAENKDEAIEKANIEIFENLERQNETLENELKWKIVCANCGVSLNLPEEDRVCIQCENN
jgi:rRNA maturation endonuclease Nob1